MAAQISDKLINNILISIEYPRRIYYKKMKLLLILVLSKNDKAQVPNLGLGYLASYLKKNYKGDSGDIDIKIIDKDYKKTIMEFSPDVVGISSISKNYDIAKDISAFCKQRKIFNIIGGAHITALPRSLNENMDVGVIGEGEDTLLEIINLFNKNTKKFPSEIPGISSKTGEKGNIDLKGLNFCEKNRD